MPLTLEVIDDFARLLQIRPEWDDLVSRLSGLTPFQLPAWLLLWWRHFGSGQLRCFVFRRSNELVGLIPCFVHEWNGARQITLLGSGISDYLEPAIQPEYSSEMVNQLRSYLEAKPDWDVCHWQDLSVHTPWRTLASEDRQAPEANPATPGPLYATISTDAPCMEIPLQGSFEAYWKSCGRGLQQNVRRDRTKAEARGTLRFEVKEEADAELLDGLILMHRDRWQRKNESGMIEANQSADFLRAIAQDFAALGLLRIFALRFEERDSPSELRSPASAPVEPSSPTSPPFTKGKLVAVILAFAYEGRMSNYLTGFDPVYERLGFGRTLLYEAVRYCFENDYKVWDFLRGDEPYKTLWGAQTIPKSRVVVKRTTSDTLEP